MRGQKTPEPRCFNMAKYKLSDIFEGQYPVSQVYGANPAYYGQFGLKGHEGVDYATPVGVNALAPFDGEILRDNDSFVNNSYGNFVVIWDPVQKCAVWHCHLSSNSVSVGQKVKRGDVVGKTGNSGNSSGPHLHENFVETDASGNRLNTGNGYQGFLNILDPNLVEWVPINSSPTPPMDPMIQKKASRYDVLEHDDKGVSIDTNKITDAEFEKTRQQFKDRKVAGGKWDKLCDSAKLPHTASVDEVVAKLSASAFDKNKFLEGVKKLLFG